MGALAAMTVLSSLLGWAAPSLISKTYTHYAATLLFFVFGVRILYEAYVNDESGESELVEVEKELAGHKGNGGGSTTSGGNAAEMGAGHSPYLHHIGGKRGVMGMVKGMVSPVLLEAFTLTFLAEWGDRSQIATIGLAAASDVLGVTLGGILGHALCTGAAVVGGKHLATHIDERMVGIFGGVLFLVFGAHSLYSGVPE